MSIISEFIRQFRSIAYKDLHSVAAVAMGANREHTPILDQEGEGVLLFMGVSFDNPACGLRVVIDEGDTDRWLRCDRMFSYAMVNPSDYFWLSRYDTVAGRYVILLTKEKYFRSKVQLIPFNEDVAAHNIIGYDLLFARVRGKIGLSTEDILRETAPEAAKSRVAAKELEFDPQRVRR